MVHTWTVCTCIVYTGIILLLLIHPFISSFFFLSNFQTFKFFVTLFSETVWPRRLKLGTNVQWTDVSCLPESGCCCLFIPLFFIFLSLKFSNINIFVILFSGTVKLRRLKLGTHVHSGQMYCVYRINAAAVYLSLYSSFFFLSNFQTFKKFVTLFSETVWPRRLKLGTNMNSEQMYRVYRNQAAATYSSL